MRVHAIIPARGGSKGIPNKNLIPICQKPLLAWSIIHAQTASHVDQVWVTSDSQPILDTAAAYGARPIKRPAELADDDSTSESAWLHSLRFIERQGIKVDLVLAMQATSPLRQSTDLDKAIDLYNKYHFDSLFASCEIEDYFVWKGDCTSHCEPVNHNYKQRRRRQEIEPLFLENGSFYIFKPENLRLYQNRLHGIIGTFPMEHWKKFQIDRLDDVDACERIMRAFELDTSSIR